MPRAARDLHPDDTTARHTLIANLYKLRQATTDRVTIGRTMGIPARSVWAIECNPAPNPILVTAQAYSRALNHRIVLTPTDLPDPEPGNALLAMYARKANTTTDPAAADEWYRMWIQAHLASARRAAGISQAHLAAVLECTDPTVRQVETGRYNQLLSTHQRHARAIATAAGMETGHLALHLEPAQVLAVAA